MSGITTGVGLFSGIDTASLIDQLIQIEARPRRLVEQRILQLQTQQGAFLDINSRLLALKSAAAAFNRDRVFRAAKAASSDPAKVSASAGTTAVPGVFNFTVSRLVSTQQRMSKGFVDQDVTGLGASSFTFESAKARLDTETTLDELNGALGVSRGSIRITDSAGGVAVVDLSTAVTVSEVIDAINQASAVKVDARVVGHHIEVVDQAGGAGSFVIEDVGQTTTASDLKIAGTAAAGGTLGPPPGQELLFLSTATALSSLNDGAGVSFGEGGVAAPADFKIVVKDAGGATVATHNIVLGKISQLVPDPDNPGKTIEQVQETAVATVGDLIDRINSQTGGDVVASIGADGRSLELTAAAGGNTLEIQEGTSGTTAADLNIAGATGATISTGRILAGINDKLAANLKGGAGVTAGQFTVTRRNGTAFNVTVNAGDSVREIIEAINAASGGDVTASLNKAGNGLTIVDSTTGGNLVITDVTGTPAADLGIATAGDADGVVDSGDLEFRYISGATLLADLNGGAGVGTGEITLVDSKGVSQTISITSKEKTVADVIRKINGAALVGLNARINDTGDGIVVEDTAGGSLAIRVEDKIGAVAQRLGIAGEAADPTTSNAIDGSLEKTVSFEATDTLTQVAEKINSEGVGVDATIVNTGSGAQPFRLVLTSENSGSKGRMIVDTGGLDLGLQSVDPGRDAVVFFGAADSPSSVLLTSSSNTLDNVVTGVTIDLLGTTTSPVEVVVSRDTEQMVQKLQEFVDAFNETLDRLDFHERFDQDTGDRGALLGDGTVSQIRAAMLRVIQGQAQGVSGQFTRPFEVGLRIGQGARLELDAERFRQALEQDPDGVAELLAAFELEPRTDKVLATDANGNPLITTNNDDPDTFKKLGVLEQIEKLANDFTTTLGGLITRRTQTIEQQINLQEGRIEAIDAQLQRKRESLQRQFQAMEQAIAGLQSQSSAISALGAFAQGF